MQPTAKLAALYTPLAALIVALAGKAGIQLTDGGAAALAGVLITAATHAHVTIRRKSPQDGPAAIASRVIKRVQRRARNPRAPRFNPHRGVWVWNDHRADEICRLLAHHGFGYVLVKAQDGHGPTSVQTPEQIMTWKTAARRHGLRFGIWGYLYGNDPVAEAILASNLIRRYGADFYVADVEVEYERSQKPLSKLFVETFRKIQPHTEAWISTFGRLDLHPGIDYRAWQRAGFGIMPQAYEADSKLLTPELCFRSARAFWPHRRVRLTLGLYAGALGRLGPAELAASLGHLHTSFDLWDSAELLTGGWTNGPVLDALARVR